MVKDIVFRASCALIDPYDFTQTWVRNGGGCAAIGAGFTVALRSYDKSVVERVTTASAIDNSGPPLVASQRNAPLQQSLVPSQREGAAPLRQPLVPLQQPLVTSQREGVAPLQQLLVPPQRLRPVSH
ncbi:hypothetical protein B296_00050784 [Ensete ventricosum]|uniref:Uncharacterized protein n=1 Tax=Ensete ventricosum TaxID=4639 RepID=A0A426WXL7_ENSVE|nr:hypothetical protein B296_00050784 [Ensete ventricosum]